MENNNLYLQMLDEAYYGKTPDLLKIEKKIGEIRQKYNSNPSKVNSAKEREELEELFCKAFGFEGCQITVDMTGLQNACTIPISLTDLGSSDKLITTSSSGVKFKKEAKAYVFITITKGLLFSFDYSDGEITAIIMHEIGHNFQSALSPDNRTIRNVNNILLWIFNPITVTLHGPLRDKYSHLIQRMRSDNPGVVNAYYGFKNIVMTIAGIGYTALRIMSNFSMLMNPIAVLSRIPQTVLQNLYGSLLSFIPLKYRDESIADAFSSAYGYGPELASAFQKMKRASNGMIADKIYRDSFVGAYFDLMTIPDKIISNIFDPHPNTIARLYNQYDMLEKELLNGNLNPKMRAQVKKDLEGVREMMDAFLDMEDQGYFFSNALDKTLLDFCNGDIRNTFARKTASDFDKIDKQYRDA